MKRRSFIKHTAHSLAIPTFLGALGQTNAYGHTIQNFLRLANDSGRVLVLIYLEGGNDGLNTIIPLEHLSALNKVRPHVIIPEAKLIKPNDGNFAFHPSLSFFKSLYEEKRLQVIHSVGYPEQNFSHFRSTDIWMSASDSKQLVSSGWGGRYLEALHNGYPIGYPSEVHPDPLAIEIGSGSSLLFQGSAASMGMVVNDPNSFYQLLDGTTAVFPETIAGEKLQHISLIAQQSQKYGSRVKDAADKIKQQQPYPAGNRLAQQLKIVSRLIAGGLQTPMYLVRLGGFDTHDNQVDSADHTTGRHAALLATLNDAIMAFVKDLEFQKIADQVLGMTFSEFGRRIVSNASFGTDHGAAAPMFIFGNSANGGELGNAPHITGNEVYVDNLPIQHDFRQVYMSVLEQWMKADNGTAVQSTLRPFDEVPVVKNNVVTHVVKSSRQFEAFPNPFVDDITLRLQAKPGTITVQLLDLSGRAVGMLYNDTHPGGTFERQFYPPPLPKGNYILKVANNRESFSRQVIKY